MSARSVVRVAPWLIALLVVAAVAVASWQGMFRAKPAIAGSAPAPASDTHVPVEVVTPKQGGIDRICRQPGNFEPFEAADLYTKVSGFLIEQDVDIGYPVKAGEVLARIAVPEHDKQVKQDQADVARAEAKVDQMKAALATAHAEVGSASAAIALAEAEKKSKASFRAYREKQRDRIRELAARMAIDAKLADEQEDQYQAAASAELAAEEAVRAAIQKKATAQARVQQAEADHRYAQAEVATAQARVERSQVFLEYAVIRSPYTGVVTKRNYHRGEFVRSADSGGERIPVLAVERIDMMRVVIQVPERDVPFVNRGDPAIVEVDALPGVVFKSVGDDKVEVSRFASSEDPHTRMMRTEVHIKNAEGKVRRGMYGRVALMLQVGAEGSLRVPSAALSGKADGGKGIVRIVRDGKAHLVSVKYGSDNGSEVEVLSGLAPTDRVIVRAAGPLEEGTPVTPTEAKATSGGH